MNIVMSNKWHAFDVFVATKLCMYSMQHVACNEMWLHATDISYDTLHNVLPATLYTCSGKSQMPKGKPLHEQVRAENIAGEHFCMLLT